MAKRILVVSQHYWPEQFRITDICESFVQKGIDVDVLCGLPNYPKGEFFEGYNKNGPFEETHNGVNIYRAKEIPRKGNTSLRIFLNYMGFPFFALFRMRTLLKNKYDAIFSYETSPVFQAYPALRFAKKTKTPCTIYVLDLWPENLYTSFTVKSNLLRKILKSSSHWHYKKADRLIAMSSSMQKMLAEATGKSPEKIAVIPQYCEDLYTQRPQVSDDILVHFKKDAFNILFAGNISPAQSLQTLVLAAKEAEKLLNDKVNYVIVGDGMSRSEIEDLCIQHGVSHLFTFTGQSPVTDIPAFQACANALFAGLSKDAMGITIPAKIASYCAAGKPLLVAIDGESAIAVSTAKCGYTSPAEDYMILAENIIKMVNLPTEELNVMGKNGFSYYEENFKKDTLLNELENFIFEGGATL